MVNIYESTIEERDLLAHKLVKFNSKKVPFEQSEDWIVLSYAVKDECWVANAEYRSHKINSFVYESGHHDEG